MYIIAKIHDKNDCSVCTTIQNKLHKIHQKDMKMHSKHQNNSKTLINTPYY